MNVFFTKKIITPITALFLCAATAAVCIAVSFSHPIGGGLENEAVPSAEELYARATIDAMLAEPNEIYPLYPLLPTDSASTWNAYGDRVLLLSWNKAPECYAEGSEVSLENGELWCFTDKEIAKWYDENKEGVTDWDLRLKQLIGLPPDESYTHVSAFWARPQDVFRPAYVSDITVSEMQNSFNGEVTEGYLGWFNDNILFSYYDSEYPWTRLGYTYDWADNDTEYGLSEFIIEKNSDVIVEFTKTNEEFLAFLDTYSEFVPKYDDVKEKQKTVKLLTYCSVLDDGECNELYKSSLNRFSNKAQLSFGESDSIEAFEAAIIEAAEAKTDLIIIPSSDAAPICERYAALYPQTVFAIADSVFNEPCENLSGFEFATWQGAFLAGFVAAKTSKSGIIAFVGGEENQEVEIYERAFIKGANFVNNNISVGSAYIGSFTDSQEGKRIANELYNGGVDIIFEAAKDAGSGVIEAAKQYGKFVICTDVDRTSDAPKNVLTCVVKNFDAAIDLIMSKTIEKEPLGGQNYLFDFTNDGISLAPNNGNVTDKLYAEALTIKEKMLKGEVTVTR